MSLLLIALLSQYEPTGVYAERVVIDAYMPKWCASCPQWKPLLVNDANVMFNFVSTDAPTNEARAYPAFYSGGTYLESAYTGMSIASLKEKALRARTHIVEGQAKDAKHKVGAKVLVEFRVVKTRLASDGRYILTLEAVGEQGTVPPYHPSFVCDEALAKPKD